MRRPLLASLLVAAAVTTAAFTVKLDESRVFAPTPYDHARAAADGERFWGERVLTENTGRDVRFPRARYGEAEAPGWDAEDWVATSATHGALPGEPAVAWTLLERQGAGRPLIVRCGGNATTVQWSAVTYALPALPHGDVLLFDYPGSGLTGGVASAESFEAARASLSAFIAAAGADRSVVLWGHSLGGFVCAELARGLPRVDGVILEATIRNARDGARAMTPRLLRPFVGYDIAPSLAAYDNVAALAGLEAPILVLGARRDEILQVSFTRKLVDGFEDAGVTVTYVEFPQAGHSTIDRAAGFAEIIASFFDEVSGGPPTLSFAPASGL